MNIKRFDIWLANLEPQIGTEPGKTRPVLIIQADALNKYHPSTIICPITTNVQPGSDILRLHLSKKESNMKQDCDIMIDQIRAIDNKRLIKKVAQLPSSLQEKLEENIKIVLELN
jgi:mRNA interferase MazF